MSVIHISNKNFKNEVLSEKQPVLVDFWAPWCGPCRALAPVIQELAEEHPDVKVGKINIDENPELAKEYQVMSIPTLVVFKNGEVIKSSAGLKPKGQIEEMLDLV